MPPFRDLIRNTHARRFVKFCIVGTSSTFILMLVESVAVRVLHGAWTSPHIPTWKLLLASSLGFAAAVVNGFVWNRRWTFRQHGTPGAAGQFLFFVVFNLVGLALNNALLYLFYTKLRLFAGVPFRHLACQLMATVCVVAWNFFANSRWTFAPRDPETVRPSFRQER